MLAPGSIIGGVRIEELLGRGGMGEVYRAEQISLKRPVAVKRIAEHLLDNQHAVNRFEREALIVAKIQNQHVIHVHDFGRFADAQGDFHYLLIMELIQDGRSLASLLGQPLDWRLASSLIMQTAEGLAAAAELGVVHRDIKPENIMLTHKGLAKLGDFGLARSVDSTSLSLGSLVGTPDYMSPEACRGELVDSRSDIYSLGCTWYELLSGRTPFHDAVNVMAVLRCHIEEQPKDIRAYGLDLPESIAALVQRCMAKNPGDRPQSSQQLLNDLMALSAEGIVLAHTVPTLLPSRPISATDPTTSLTDIAAPNGIESVATTTPRNSPKPKRKPLLIAIGGVIALALIFVVCQRNSFAAQRSTVIQIRSQGELGLAMQRAQALFAAYPERLEAFEEVRLTAMAQIDRLLTDARYDEAVRLAGTFREKYPELADQGERRTRLRQAGDLALAGKFPESAAIYAALREAYPRDIELCRLVIRDHYEHENTDGIVRHAAFTIIQEGTGPIDPDIREIALGVLRYFSPHSEFAGSLRRELARREPALAETFRAVLTVEADEERINAYEFLKETKRLSDGDGVRYQFFTLTRCTLDTELREAVDYSLREAKTADWPARKQAAGINPITTSPQFEKIWGEQKKFVANALATAFLPEIVDALPTWALAGDEDTREQSWAMLKQAQLTERIDRWKFHATTLEQLEAMHDTPMYRDALQFFAATAGTADAAKALEVLARCRVQVEAELKRCEERLPLHAKSVRARLPEIDEVIGKLKP